jgi:hypothetical protein
MATKDWIAIYAAIIATANVLWTLYRGWLARKRLDVAVIYGKVKFPNEPELPPEARWVISVSNLGKSPVLLAEIGFTYQDGRSSIVPGVVGGLKPLLPGAQSNYAFGPSPAVEEVKQVWVEDYTGKRFLAGKAWSPQDPIIFKGSGDIWKPDSGQ